MKRKPVFQPRAQAVAAIGEVLDSGRNLTECRSLQGEADSRDLALARHLAYGTIRWLTALEWLAAQLLSKPLKQRDNDIHRLVLIGIHQLWQDRVPAHAAINETAECARILGKPWAVALVNAVLRRFQREQEDQLRLLEQEPEQYAHPGWIHDRIRSDWPADWQDVLNGGNQSPTLWLRINRRLISVEDETERLEDQGFEVQHHPFATDAVAIVPAVNVHALPGFTAGHLSVQDPAAQLAAGLLRASDGMRVLDACASPGGKACHVLEQTPGVQLTAVEVQAHRAELIRENLARLKLNCEVIVADATEPDSWWDGRPFQRILIDAPCSASGVIRRHPEIKHLRTPVQVADAVALQRRLLLQLWPLLAPGGILVYATCSIFNQENSPQIGFLLEQCANASELAITAEWGRPLVHGRQILPGEHDMDGFYYAVVQKNV